MVLYHDRMDGYIVITRKVKVPEIYHFDEDFEGKRIQDVRKRAIRHIQGIPRKSCYVDVGAEIGDYNKEGSKEERIYRIGDGFFVCVRRDRYLDGRKHRTTLSKSLIKGDAFDGVTAFRVSPVTGDLGTPLDINYLRMHYPYAVKWAKTKTDQRTKEEPFYFNNWE